MLGKNEGLYRVNGWEMVPLLMGESLIFGGSSILIGERIPN